MKTSTQRVEGGYELIHYWYYPYPSGSIVVTVLLDPEGWFVMEASTLNGLPADGICANIKEIYEEMGWDHD